MREPPVPAHESDFMASVRVRPMRWVFSKKPRYDCEIQQSDRLLPDVIIVNVFKGRGGNYRQSRIPLHAGSFVS